MTEEKKNDDRHESREIVMDEFLLETIVSLRETLSSLEKDTKEKTDLFWDISDNLKGIKFNLQDIKNRTEANEKHFSDLKEFVSALNHQVDSLFDNIDMRDDDIKTHIQEVKYTLQQIKDSLTAGLAKCDAKKEKTKKKYDLLMFFNDLWDFAKNIKAILTIVFLIFIVLISVLFGQDVANSIMGFFRN